MVVISDSLIHAFVLDSPCSLIISVDSRPSSPPRYSSSGFNSHLQSPLPLRFFFFKPRPLICPRIQVTSRSRKSRFFFPIVALPRNSGKNWHGRRRDAVFQRGYRDAEPDMKGDGDAGLESRKRHTGIREAGIALCALPSYRTSAKFQNFATFVISALLSK
jgi:hypothetical protein